MFLSIRGLQRSIGLSLTCGWHRVQFFEFLTPRICLDSWELPLLVYVALVSATPIGFVGLLLSLDQFGSGMTSG